MSAKRPPAPPPELTGFDYISLLGSGGFADVFLYQQHLPKRQVAVKVLLAEKMSTSVTADFAAEANLMAQLSTHPAIVSIYQAGVSDDGRPYLIMENCPKANLQVRYRRERFSVAEALRVGIQVAGAVETAHRAGILHRDIKPANVLVTAYNRPALTDFGIAGTAGASAEAVGMSIPWSPPESFADVPSSSVQTDVYALGATIYTLLAGRSPFEIPGERNTGALLVERIHSTPVPPLGREDVPASLESVLATAMAKAPAGRYASALDLARALQKVQIELSMSVTPAAVLDDSVEEIVEEDEGDGRTRVKSIVSIDPSAPPTGSIPVASAPAAPRSEPRFAAAPTPQLDDDAAQTVMRGAAPANPAPASAAIDGIAVPGTTPAATPSPAPGVRSFSQLSAPDAPAVEDTMMRTAAPKQGADASAHAGAASSPVPAAKSSAKGLIAGGVVVALVGAVVLAVTLTGGGEAPPDDTPTAVVPQDNVVQEAQVPVPANLAGVIDGETAIFTWENPDPQEGDLFQWAAIERGVDPQFETTPETSVVVPLAADGTACIEVLLRRANGRFSESREECAA